MIEWLGDGQPFADEFAVVGELSISASANVAASQAASPAANTVARVAGCAVGSTRGHVGKTKNCPGGRRARDQRGSYARRLVANLRRSECAIATLAGYGINLQTIEALGLGIKEPHNRADGNTVSGVLVYPIGADDGRTRYGCINLAGTTENPEHAVGWSVGPAEGVSYGTGSTAVVCASALEAWVALQAAQLADIDITVMASTQPDRLPPAWGEARSWSGWHRVVVTDGVSKGLLGALTAACGRPLERCSSVPTPGAGEPADADELADWVAAVAQGERRLVLDSNTDDLLKAGDFEAGRISVHGGLHDGRMYYAFAVERRERRGPGDGFVFSYRTLVIRSDGAVLEPGTLPAPRGTPADRRVHALSDGTRVAADVRVPACASWSLAGIKRFAGRAKSGDVYDGPSGPDLLAKLTAHLRTVVWLPDGSAHEMIARYIMATYFFRAFDAFPILFIEGAKGTGKSELTAAVASLAFNGSLMAQGSGAALIRLVREGGGLVAIDDAETLAAGFGELAQVLKCGYKARTAVKCVVSPSGAVETVDFYGPRVLCNTRGLDDVLLSRCIKVATAPMPSETDVGDGDETDLPAMRDLLHDFSMSHIGDMVALLSRRGQPVRDRQDEVSLPMRAIDWLLEELGTNT